MLVAPAPAEERVISHDELIDKIIFAPNREELVAATRALDRVLLWNHFVIPQFYNKSFWVAYWNRFSRPEIQPKYAIGFFDTWWVDPEKDAALKAKEAAQPK